MQSRSMLGHATLLMQLCGKDILQTGLALMTDCADCRLDAAAALLCKLQSATAKLC